METIILSATAGAILVLIYFRSKSEHWPNGDVLAKTINACLADDQGSPWADAAHFPDPFPIFLMTRLSGSGLGKGSKGSRVRGAEGSRGQGVEEASLNDRNFG